MTAAIPAQLLAALRQLDTCGLANAIETFNVRLRNEGFTDARIRSQFPRLAPMVGHAVTVRIRCSGPPVETSACPEQTDWWNHVLSQAAPRVVVVQDMDERPGAGAFIGEVHAAILRALGCVGAVTNGAVRDLPAVEAAGFPLFAGNAAVSHSYAHIVEVGAEIEVGGLKIKPGDWLHGDGHGVLKVPPELGGRLPAAAKQILERERQIIALCAAGDVTPEQLRSAVSDGILPGGRHS